jgi:hypothetical protein
MRYIFAVLMLSALPAVSSKVWASKPISWAEGIAVATMNDGDGSMNHVTYSFSGKNAVSVRADYFFNDDSTLVGVQGHHLVKRWNFPGAQANIYIGAGAGVATRDNNSNAAVFGGVMADYETRRFYLGYELDAAYGGEVLKYDWHRARIGWAPYAAKYEDVQPWFMMQVDYRSDQAKQFTITPMIRLFTPSWMFEAGISTRGKPMVNLMVQW